MPSLRRTMSTPAVRSSPYPSSLSASLSSSQAALRSQPGGNRRSSGSDIIGRRVLADIDWWRVTEGQCDPDAERATVDNVLDTDHDRDQVADGVETSGGAGPGPSAVDLDWSIPQTPPLVPSRRLTSSPVTPRSRRRHTLEGSSSSLNSTPESTAEELEELRHELHDLTLGPNSPSPSTHIPKTDDIYPALAFMRSHSLEDCAPLGDDEHRLYADFAISPLSSRTVGILN